jgi:hypothetical protein
MSLTLIAMRRLEQLAASGDEEATRMLKALDDGFRRFEDLIPGSDVFTEANYQRGLEAARNAADLYKRDDEK